MQASSTSTTVRVGSAILPVEVADTPAKRELGLSERESLQEDSGLLFVFQSDEEWGIWMKDMRFPIDIIWASKEGVVVHVEKNVSPETFPEVFSPDVPARYVLEVNAGFAVVHGIGTGSQFQVENAKAPR